MGSFPPRKLLVYIWQECKNCLGGERGSVNSVKFQFCFIYSPLRLQEIALLAFPDNKQKYKGQSWYHDINPCRHQPSCLIQATASPQINYYFFQQDMFFLSCFFCPIVVFTIGPMLSGCCQSFYSVHFTGTNFLWWKRMYLSSFKLISYFRLLGMS